MRQLEEALSAAREEIFSLAWVKHCLWNSLEKNRQRKHNVYG
jgi:hypothetical protein